MCKKYLFCIVVLMILLSACERKPEILEVSQPNELEIIGYESIESDLNALPYARWNDELDGLVLVDLLTNEILLESDIFDYTMMEIHSLSAGYWGAFGRGNEPEEGWNFDNWADWTDADISFLVFNERLELIDSFAITDEDVIFSLHEVAIMYMDGELIIYLYHFNFDESGIYAYHANVNERTFVMEIENDINVWLLEFVDTHRLAFIGNHPEDEINIYFGTIDLEKREVSYARTDLPISSMNVSEKHVLLTEQADISFNPDGTTWNIEARGEVLVFDWLTLEDYIVQLEGDESMNAIVVQDRYVLTATTDMIRLYEMDTSQKLFERIPMIRIESDEEATERIDPWLDNFFMIDETLYAIVFNLGDDTFHTELVEINN